MFIAVILIYILIGAVESYPLIKKKERKKLFFYVSFMLFSMTISALLSAGIKLYSPSKAIENLMVLILGKSILQ